MSDLRVLTTPIRVRGDGVEALFPEGWKTVVVPDLDAALGRDDVRSFDVLLLDLTGASRPDIERVARAVGAFRHGTVVAMSDHEDSTHIQAVVAAGAQDHVDRNRITANALQRILRTAVERDRLRRERDVALHEAQESENRFRTLADAADDIVFRIATGNGYQLEYVNPAVERTLGVAPAKLLGDTHLLLDRCHPDDLALFQERLAQPGDGTYPDPCRFFHADGRIVWLEYRLTGERDELGQRVAIHGIARDVTQRQLDQQALSDALEREQEHVEHLRRQKLESLGRLAAGVAHELNTPIQFVSDNTRFLRDAFAELQSLLEVCRRLDDGATIAEVRAAAATVELDFLAEEVPAAVDEALTGLQHMAKLVSAMKDFAHPGTQEKTSQDLNRIIETVVTVTRNEYKYVADLEFQPSTPLPEIACHADQIGQTVLNLIVNAAQAIAESPAGHGRIVVSTAAARDAIELRVADTGPGIPADVVERVFDPFFTTKDVGKGTGQGLAIARSIVTDRHGGTLEVEATGTEGTTFVLRLPLAA